MFETRRQYLKIIFVVLSILIGVIVTGCFNQSTTENGDNNNKPPIPETITDYYPIKPNTKYTYEGYGNEFAGFTSYVDYTLDDKVQYKKINSGTHVAEIISVKDGKVTRLYSEGEMYFREDYLRNPALITYNNNEILLKEPLVVGNTWTGSNGLQVSITKTDAEINTDYGKFKGIEVTKEEFDGNKTLSYYVKGIGLVKTIFVIPGVDEITASLKALEENTGNTIDINLYYPNVNDDQIYYIRANIKYYTNDITRKKIEEAYKSYLTDPLKNQGLMRVFTDNTKINYLFIDKNRIVRVDLSQDFIKEMNLGAGYESLVLKALTNTFAMYYGTDRIRLTIGNDNYSSGHIYLDDYDYLYANFKNTEEFK
ncbi:MAG: GerMN domain-containing protein [Fusobacteria bacterium]|nr:GerMN domain-containing protein [Fusobacteriota bacterium]